MRNHAHSHEGDIVCTRQGRLPRRGIVAVLFEASFELLQCLVLRSRQVSEVSAEGDSTRNWFQFLEGSPSLSDQRAAV